MSDRDDARREGRSSAWALIGTAVGAVANFAVLLVVTAAYGQTLFGVFAAVTAAFQLSAVLFRLGAEVGATYEIARLEAAGRSTDARAVLVAALVPVVLVSVLVATVVFVAADPIARALTEPADTAAYRAMLRVVAVALPVATIGEVLLGATRGFASMRPTVIASNFGRQGGQLITVSLAAALSSSPAVLAFAWSIPYVATVAYPAWWLRTAFKEMRPSTLRAPWGPFWRYTTPQATNAAVQGGLEKVDIIMLGRLSGADATAVYALANRFVHVVVLARYAINISQAANMARGFEENAIERVQSLSVKVATWTAILCGPVLWLLVIFPESFLTLVGPEYAAGSTSLTILAAAVLLSLVMGPVEGLLLMSGSSVRVMVNNSIALALNIALNIWLIRAYGPSGAAIAWAISLLLARVLSFVPLYREHGIVARGRPLLVAIIIPGLWFGLVGIVARMWLGDDWPALILTVVIGGAGAIVSIARASQTVMIDELIDGLRPQFAGEGVSE